MFFLERNSCLDKFQCGFRSARSTVDHLVRFETFVREAFVNRQQCLSIFFDLEKAYDTAWRYGILQYLFDLGFRGRMLSAIQSYLQHRTFRVRLGKTLSREFLQENGVPQGGVLSVTLFIVKLNSIGRVIPPSVQYSLYVDDLQISVSSCNLSICERRVQLAVNNLVRWADTNGFKFSPEKTACVNFSRRRGALQEPSLNMYGSPIVVKNEHKFLGLVFDSKLTFVPHIKRLKLKCLKSLNILKVLSHASWGSDRLCLLRIYHSVIRSQLDYGCIVYNSARASVLKMLDPIHHQGLRLAIGAFRTSPVLSLYAEANELSLEYRRFSLGFMYSVRVRSVAEHPVRDNIETIKFQRTFENKPSTVPPFSMRNNTAAQSVGMDAKPQLVQYPPEIAPWNNCQIHCDLTLTKYNKKNVPQEVIRQNFFELQTKYHKYASFYTDGTKKDSVVGCAMVGPSVNQVKRINSKASILTAELYGLLLAVDYIIKKRLSHAVIYTDSLSSLKAVASMNRVKNPLVSELKYKIILAATKNFDIVLCWVPSHVGIPGNEAADSAASSANDREIDTHQIPYKDYHNYLKRCIKAKWQLQWNGETGNKLHAIKPLLGEWESARHRERFYEVVLCRLRIGHTRLTHGHLLSGEEAPECVHCNLPLSIMHILIECPMYDQCRYKHYSLLYKEHIPLHLALLLGDEPLIPYSCVFNFLTDIGLLHRL